MIFQEAPLPKSPVGKVQRKVLREQFWGMAIGASRVVSRSQLSHSPISCDYPPLTSLVNLAQIER